MYFEGTKLQQAFDNTSLSIFKDCPRKYQFSILEGWRPKRKAPPLLFGGAIHDVFEQFDKGIALGEDRETVLRRCMRLSFELSGSGFGDDNRRTRLTLLRSLVWYADHYRNDQLKTFVFPNGRVGLEMSFSFELPFSPQGSNDHYYYSGHIDKLATYNGLLYVVERKHTTGTLGSQFFDRYTFSSQVSGYVFAGKVVFESPVQGAIIDATAVAVNSSSFGRSVVNRVGSHLEEWMQDLGYWIKQIEECVREQHFPMNTESCSKYAGCQYRQVCSKSKAVRELELETAFHREHWNPLRVRGED